MSTNTSHDPSAAAQSASAPRPAPAGASLIDDLVAANARYAASFEDPGLKAAPARHVAVVTCMDARIDLPAALGLSLGDIHTVRNAGGAITDDTIRSLAISQRELGTRAVMLIHHTTCGMGGITEDFRAELEAEVGQRPTWSVEAFSDADQDVRQSMQRVRTSPFLPHRDDVRGFVFDVHTGALREITGA